MWTPALRAVEFRWTDGVHTPVLPTWEHVVVEQLESFTYECPRCSRSTTSVHYGPCDECAAELRVTVAGAARAVDGPAYEPKLNVTPNAVALKE